MNSHKTPLKTLQDLAHTRVDEATRRLGELIASEQACEVKLQMLRQYRAEYHERFMETARNGIDPNAWRNYSSFIARLDDAINSQQQVVARSVGGPGPRRVGIRAAGRDPDRHAVT